MRPTFTILIGSKGRDTLATTLASIATQQLIPGDQVWVGFDGLALTGQPLYDAINLVSRTNYHRDVHAFQSFVHTGIADRPKIIPGTFRPDGKDLHIAAGDPYSWLGVEQINYALRELPITGSHIFTLGDDDIFVDGAFEVIRDVCAQDQSRPVLYRFLSPAMDRLWDRPRLEACKISGCCIAAPRQFVGLHPTDIETTHDFRWIDQIVRDAAAQGHPPVWLDYVGVVARPRSLREAGGVWTCSCLDYRWNAGWGFVADGVPAVCHLCGCSVSYDANVVAGER